MRVNAQKMVGPRGRFHTIGRKGSAASPCADHAPNDSPDRAAGWWKGGGRAAGGREKLWRLAARKICGGRRPAAPQKSGAIENLMALALLTLHNPDGNAAAPTGQSRREAAATDWREWGLARHTRQFRPAGVRVSLGVNVGEKLPNQTRQVKAYRRGIVG